MKKIILFSLNLLISISIIYPQNAREAEFPKEKIVKKLPVTINKQFKVSASAFSESFEDATFPPDGWQAFLTGGSGWSRESAGTPLPGWNSKIFSTPSGGGNFVAYCTWNNSTTFNNQWLVSPQVQDIQPGDKLYFWLRNQVNFADTVYIYYTIDGTNFTQIGRVSYDAASDTNWGLWFISIGDVITPGSNVNFVFQEFVLDNSANGGAISLDLIYTVSYPANINLNKSFTFGDPANQLSYRMIGLPGNINKPIGPLMNGEQKKDWNVFYDDGSEPVNLREFDGQATFNFRPGKGFWVLSRNPVNIPQEAVSSATVDGNNIFQMNLNPGWNIISNPFERSVNWIEVQNINGITQPLNLFEGTYSQPTNMETYKGYYFFNADNRGSIFIPYNPGGTLGKNKITEGGGTNYSDLEISLIVENQKRSAAFVSINPNSLKEYDKFDIFAPPGNFEEAKVSIFNELLPSYKYLMTDSRNEIGEGQNYDLKVKNSTGKICFINVEGLENFGSNEIYLFDLRLNKSYNLKIQSKIEIGPLHENNELRLLIGSKDYIDKTEVSELPSDYKLYQNYPNPFSQNYPNSFNPSTILSFDLPRNQSINLVIYNMLGERIKTIYSGYLEAGKHEFAWDGTNDSNAEAASGAYIYSLEGQEIRIAKKMILNR